MEAKSIHIGMVIPWEASNPSQGFLLTPLHVNMA